MNALLRRTITALIAAPIAIWIIFGATPMWFILLTGLILLIASWEWSTLMGWQKPLLKIFYVIVSAVVMALFFIISHYTKQNPNLSYFFLAWLLLLFIAWCLSWVVIAAYSKNGRSGLNNTVMLFILGIFVVVGCWWGLNVIHSHMHGKWLTLYLLLLVWAVDTGAFFAGKAWGKRKLIPNVSPGKTLVGFYGGLVLGLVIAIIALILYKDMHQHAVMWLLWAILTMLYSVAGDLFISVLKRQQGIKDTGNILPGHGGLLDRIDSLTSAAPIFALGLILLGAS